MKVVLALLAFMALIASVSAHGRLINPVPLKHPGPFKDNRIGANSCGNGVVVSGNAVATFRKGTTQTLTWTVDNGDGAGPLAVKFDASGRGNNFNTVAKMVKNVGGLNGGVPNSFPRGPTQISFVVPNISCKKCVMQVRQALTNGKDGFGSCAVVAIQ